MNAVIFDIDNTLAYIDKSVKGFRKNYDWSRVDEDKPIRFLTHMIYMNELAFHKIFYSTGRDESARDKTLAWLNKYEFSEYEINSTELYMKPASSYEKSTITKHRAYLDIIKDYNVRLVVDDDPKVISMFTAMGVNCLQPFFLNP